MKFPDYYRAPNPLYRKLVIAGSLVLGVMLLGTSGYMVLQKWNFLDAVYMTVITIATVGFREVRDLSSSGRIFTMILILLGIGVGSYAVGNIAAFFVEGQILDLLRGRKMEKEITNLKNHIIVAGYGKIGIEVCSRLHNMQEKFIVIDKDEDKISEALAKDYLAAVGEATDDEILERAGVKYARGLISAISDDSANVYLVLTARALNANLRIIARGTDEASLKKMIRAGADRVVSPFEIGARRMAALMVQPDIIDFIDAFSPGATLGLRLEKVELLPSSNLVGKRLDESHIKRDTGGALILAIEEPGLATQINPLGSTILKANDKLLAIADDEQITRLKQLAC
ncbi:MAG: potassium channel protein [Actinobacteria bacterium]|nr:potassium channel protein [Actinomycetota bacterium]